MKTISSKVVKKFITRSPSLLSSSASLTSIASFNVCNKAFPSSLLNDFSKFCYQRDLPRAMQALELMHTHCIWADCIAYSELIKCCLARRAIQHGKRVHVHLFSNGHVPKTFLINILINMYVKFGLLPDAQDVFEKMPDRNVVSWTTMISAYSAAKLNDKALEFLVLMQREGVRPNMFTYSSVLRACDGLFNLRQLHCCIIKIGLDSDVFVRSALIDVYSRWGQLENALRVFDEMVTGDLVVWSSIIAGLAQNSDEKDVISWSTMIAGLAQNGYSKEALKLFESMKEIKVALVVRICLASREWGKERRRRPIEQFKSLIGFI
ncbi:PENTATRICOPEPTIDE REPEAT-CONTAINING PROTEIN MITOCHONDRIAL [Salix koriyanagi]|uniref:PENTATRICOPEPTIDE REPEAT-CONTAINING PROTEIN MITOCHONDRIAL n=1 Tax=Salix koriyanagi TaxID=2511006 RepID=A0A9Q0UZY0_9ROSI|nr:PENTATRICOPEPTIDE REPEAT-CONTAINING PROTEIN MITOCHONDRIAL [Salix koriyanagi]